MSCLQDKKHTNHSFWRVESNQAMSNQLNHIPYRQPFRHLSPVKKLVTESGTNIDNDPKIIVLLFLPVIKTYFNRKLLSALSQVALVSMCALKALSGVSHLSHGVLLYANRAACPNACR